MKLPIAIDTSRLEGELHPRRGLKAPSQLPVAVVCRSRYLLSLIYSLNTACGAPNHLLSTHGNMATSSQKEGLQCLASLPYSSALRSGALLRGAMH